MQIKLSKAVFFLLPVGIPLILFWIIPNFISLGISFTDWDFMTNDFNFVGLENYFNLFTQDSFMQALLNTFYFGIGTVIPTIALGLGFALFFRKKFKGSALYQLMIFSPWVTPTIAVSIVWSLLYEPQFGLINKVLNIFGIPGLDWLQSSKTAMLAVIIVTVWKLVGWTMIFYIGALEKVPDSLYEAASIDGANSWKKFQYVTLPMVSSTTFFLVVVNTISSVQAYDQIKILTQGGPSGSTRTLLYLFFQQGFEQFDMGSATAIAFIILIITILLSVINKIIGDKWVNY
ncbi:sugar ABC transporter permease [Bacillus albus]|uniref:carbohydrate ABC transporter permease n=1 Tax=Bacillus cereus group TaxID=86661 RepID=UPI0022E67C59|nr:MULTISPECIES: sugar ABC transporter permease [Bacillus cereus group]MDA2025570.1 sugar ABC transporter permease [Bacillus cereus group sp. Bcc03]MDA2216330.1 sugar ABC transporter permease [Bacillus cereus group sp. Bc228]MDA2228061.1 sugar ABC transporter permease [Bacillus cereus group sp. Bc227]MDA2260327.1 sugar ABC transporter permease [Bacillus cereus group sp. Bc200]MDA2713099.1 sugar ABC transporter permease [Bacillus cereus group sp. Bc025]